MSSEASRETSVEEFEGVHVSKPFNSETRPNTHVDTLETNSKENGQEDSENLGSRDDDDGDGDDSNEEDDNKDDNEKQDGEKDVEENDAEDNKSEEARTHPAEASIQVNNAALATAGDWQAIWSPQYNAYCFYNSRTQETTWINPLQPQPGTSTSTNANADPGSSSLASSSSYPDSSAALYAAAEAAGIDPSLAHLDPTLVMPGGGTPSGAFAAKFNARTGTFTRQDGRDPSFLSEAERAKRMSSVYFDVNAWEAELEQRYEEEAMNGKKRKRPTKKDLERFKEQKRQKKIAKTAWLRT